VAYTLSVLHCKYRIVKKYDQCCRKTALLIELGNNAFELVWIDKKEKTGEGLS